MEISKKGVEPINIKGPSHLAGILELGNKDGGFFIKQLEAGV